MRAAAEEDLFPVPSFHRELVRGVATCAFELLRAKPDLHSIYVPIGCGSGICGAIAARDALGLGTRIVGVVSTLAQSALLSVAAGSPVATASARTFADGMAVRVPVAEALAIYAAGAERIVSVDEDEIAAAIRLLLSATHNLAEGAGAAGLAALLKDKEISAGRDVDPVGRQYRRRDIARGPRWRHAAHRSVRRAVAGRPAQSPSVNRCRKRGVTPRRTCARDSAPAPDRSSP